MTSQPVRATAFVIVTLVAVAVAWLWLVTYGTWQLAEEEWLSQAFDSLARSVVRGEVTVDSAAIRWEGIRHGDRVVLYQSPFPALLRIIPLQLWPETAGRWARTSCWLAVLLSGVSFTVLVWRAAGTNLSVTQPRRGWLVAWSVLGFGLGSPVAFLISCARLYHEAILWGVAWSVAGLLCAWEASRDGVRQGLALAGLAVCTGGALLSRLTFGLPLLVIWVALAAWTVTRCNTGGEGGPARRKVAGVVVGVLVLGAALALAAWYNHARFGSVWKTFDYSGFYLDPANFGGELNLRRLPSVLVNYFGFFPSYLSSQPPFVRMAHSWYADPTVFNEWREESISLTFASSWLVVGAVLGVVAMLRRRDWKELTIQAAVGAQALMILTFYFVTQRYQGDLLPAFVFAFAVFLARTRLDSRAGRWLAAALPLLVLTSCFASVASALDWNMRLSGDTARSYKLFLARTLSPRALPRWQGRRVYLSHMMPTRTTASFAAMGVNTSWDGRPLTIGGRVLAEGLGMHAVSTATYTVPEGATDFEALIGLAGSVAGSDGAAQFLVLGQDESILFDSGVVVADAPERVVRVPLRGAKEVTLKLDDGGNGINSDHGVWGEASFLLPK
ncbi:MAG: NPCBM/NEW2 domain-containing protein [Thermoanaerobaculaceae bacterium]